MPVSGLASFRAQLSYDEIKSYTGWEDNVMVNDYLGISSSNTAIIDQVNLNEASIVLNAENIALNFQYLHGAADKSSDYDDVFTSYAVGDLVTSDDNEYSANVVIPAPAGAFDPLKWDRVSTTDNYFYLKVHESESVAHGADGDIVGNLDFCTSLIGGVVLLMDLVADAVASTATVTTADVGAAPAAYDQSYADDQTDLVNDVKAKHNTLLADLNNAIAQLNELIANSKSANQMDV